MFFTFRTIKMNVVNLILSCLSNNDLENMNEIMGSKMNLHTQNNISDDMVKCGNSIFISMVHEIYDYTHIVYSHAIMYTEQHEVWVNFRVDFCDEVRLMIGEDIYAQMLNRADAIKMVNMICVLHSVNVIVTKFIYLQLVIVETSLVYGTFMNALNARLRCMRELRFFSRSSSVLFPSSSSDH